MEKKRVQVVVDAGGGEAAPHQFDFAGFQSQFYGDAPQLQVGTEGYAPPEETAYVTSYQVRKTSIVDGMTAEGLVDEHRKSIAAVAVKECGVALHPTDMGGITLSKRHGLTKIEYEADLDAGVYTNLENYQFGDALQ